MNQIDLQAVLAPSQNSLLTFFKAHDPKERSCVGFSEITFCEGQGISQNTNCTYVSSEKHHNSEQYEDHCNSNAIGFYMAKKIMNGDHQAALSHEPSAQADDSRTVPIHQKMKLIPTDEENTRPINRAFKAAISQQIKNQTALQQTQKKVKPQKLSKIPVNPINPSESSDISVKIDIPASKKVEQILQKDPLRVRYSGLLKDHQKYQIGQDHMKLLRILRAMDSTIEFLTMNRKAKFIFFYDLKKSLYDNNRMEVTQKNLQQLLFIDDSLFNIKWENNFKVKGYDLMITPSEIKSEDERIQTTRKKIVNYLLALELQYLSQKKAEKVKIDGWSEGFNPNLYEIPIKSLPVHPFTKEVEIRDVDESKIQNIKNANLKRFMKDIKDESDAKSLRSQDVASMIFAKKTSACIKEKLLEAVKEKQAKIALIPQNPSQVIDNVTLVKVCDEIMVVYMSKGVSNIFKATLLEILHKRLSLKLDTVTESLNIILQAKNIQFLKEITASNKTVVIQINKTKFNDMMQHLKNRP